VTTRCLARTGGAPRQTWWAACQRGLTHLPVWAGCALLGGASFVVYLATGWSGPRENTDVQAADTSAWQLGQHGTLDLSNYHGRIDWVVHVGSALYTNRFPGVIAAGAPFYALLGDPGRRSYLPGTVAAATWTAAAVALSLLVFLRLASPRTALLAALVLGFATPTWSVSADGLWTHGPNQFAILLGLLLLANNRFAASGLSFAVSILIRPHMAIASAAIGIWHSRERRAWRVLVAFGIMGVVGTAALLAYNHALFGTWSVLGGYDKSQLQASGVGPLGFVVNVAGALISPQRGVLLLTPFLWMLLPGLPGAWKSAPSWVRSAAVGGLAYALVQLYLLPFMGGHAFYSFRTMIEPLTLAAPLLLVSYQSWTARHPVRRAIFFGLVWLSFSYHAFGAVLDQHRAEAGNPFRTFSAWPVAQQVGPMITAVWMVGTLFGLALIARRGRGNHAKTEAVTAFADTAEVTVVS
jgi:hypothetical protein